MLPGRSASIGSGERSSGSNGPRKMVIKPFKVQPKAPENFWLESWEKLRSAVSAVYAQSASQISKEELYRSVEDLCKQKEAQQLYDALSALLKEFIVAKVDFLQNNQSSDVDSFLNQVQRTWRDHCTQLGTIRNIFLFLDRNFALQTSGVKVLWDLGHGIFRDRLEQAPSLQHHLVHCLLVALDRLRQGAAAQEEDRVGDAARMLSTLGLYQSVFQQAFLQDAARFYSAEGKRFIEQLDTAAFLVLVDKRLNECVELTTRLLDHSTRKPLIEVVEAYLLVPHVQVLLDRGAVPLLQARSLPDLKRMFLLLDRVRNLEKLRLAWGNYIKLAGENLIRGPTAAAGVGPAEGKEREKDTEVVDEVLQLQTSLVALLRDAFFSQDGFKQTLKAAFDYFLNINMRATAEQVAKYVDKRMRGEKGVTESEAESRLESVMSIFKHLQEKDIFEAFYKKHLARRLLQGKSASDELEKSMLAKLKAECGANFTSKLEGMFHDMELSKSCQVAFQTHLTAQGYAPSLHAVSAALFVPEPDVGVQVLTTGYWPSPPPSAVSLPAELASLLRRFESFYETKFQGRRLVWAHALSRCVMTFRPQQSGGKKELEVSLFQALVLRCFVAGGAADWLTLEEIVQRTGLEGDELKRTMLSLAHLPGSPPLLLKEPKGRDVRPGDRFAPNDAFSSRQFRIKVGTLQAKEQSEEAQRTHEEVSKDREYQADAAIVRTMKSRKRLPHSTLISEVMAQLRYPAQSADLKKRIEALIERDFLERDADDPSVYNYLA